VFRPVDRPTGETSRPVPSEVILRHRGLGDPWRRNRAADVWTAEV